jgi:hypothetical protein
LYLSLKCFFFSIKQYKGCTLLMLLFCYRSEKISDFVLSPFWLGLWILCRNRLHKIEYTNWRALNLKMKLKWNLKCKHFYCNLRISWCCLEHKKKDEMEICLFDGNIESWEFIHSLLCSYVSVRKHLSIFFKSFQKYWYKK